MLGHYLKIAARHLIKHKGHSLINVLGLALGMACCLLILLFLRDELSFDRYQRDAGRIYRVTVEMTLAGQQPMHGAITPRPLAPALLEEIPEIAEATRIMPYFEGALPGRAAVSYRNEKQFYDLFAYVDPGIFHVFTLPLVAGDPETALAEPGTVAISESTARRYFGDQEAVGKVLRIDSGFSDEDYRITAVFRDVPAQSHLHFNVLVSLKTLEHVHDPRLLEGQWYMNDFYTYVKLAEGASIQQLEARLPAFIDKHFPPVPGMERPKIVLDLQPITDIHLSSHLVNEWEVNGDVTSLYVFGAIAALTLLIACVNFMNLSTARFSIRAREVGMRKVVGAHRSQIIVQFLGESILLCALAMVLAVLLVRITLPAFNALAGRQIAFRSDAVTWAGLAGLTLLVGVAAGSYPALFLSGFRPVQVLKVAQVGGVGSGAFRKVLIIFQFAVSVALLIGVGVIWDQLRYMRSQKLGYDIGDVVVLPIRDTHLRESFSSLKEEIERLPNVQATTFSSMIVGRETPQILMDVEGARNKQTIGSLIVDRDVQNVFKLGLVAGRPLAPGEESTEAAGFLVNETAVRFWGFSSPREILGRPAVWGGRKKGKVVGVVRDFHHRPFQFEVEPLVLHIRPISFHYLYVRIAPRGRAETLRALEAAWHRLLPSKPFEYFFLDDELARYYRSEERLGQLVGAFALVAVFVACLGLFGLASFTTERRRREIGIRKVLGISVAEVVLLLSRETTVLVTLANLIAWPVAWFLLRKWLEGFAYRTDIHLSRFILGGLIALALAWLTVSYQTLRAALVDPAEALRYE